MLELSLEDRMQAEFLVEQPSELNNWIWAWCVYLPHIGGQPVLSAGKARDKEHATQCALKALNSIRQYGNNSVLFRNQ